MPAFIKTPADEKKWNAIKHSVAKQRGKKESEFTDSDWATVNAAWHKSEVLAKGDGTTVPKAPGILSPPKAPTSVSIKAPMKVGTQATVKMPKAKKMPDGFGKPSLFFKSENFNKVKHPTLCKLRDFLGKKHKNNR